MKTIIPECLHEGDTVGIVSPSGPVGKEKKQFLNGVKRLESWGLKVKYSKMVFDRHYYSAGTCERRLKEFHQIWKDPKVKLVLMTQGGFTANHMLDGIDYRMIKKNPKMFAGFSDGSTLVNAIYAKTGLITYHGPDLMWTFAYPMSKSIEENIRKTFFEGRVGQIKPNLDWKHKKNKKLKRQSWRSVRKGKASGILVGGHVAIVCGNMLAGYFPDTKNKILFLEGTDAMDELDWYFNLLRLKGTFKEINGMIIGWFEGREMKTRDRDREVAEMVLEATKGYEFPILEIGELGHNVENYVFPIGVRATIDAGKRFLSIDGKTAR